jgi:hypothetical protein
MWVDLALRKGHSPRSTEMAFVNFRTRWRL